MDVQADTLDQAGNSLVNLCFKGDSQFLVTVHQKILPELFEHFAINFKARVINFLCA